MAPIYTGELHTPRSPTGSKRSCEKSRTPTEARPNLVRNSKHEMRRMVVEERDAEIKSAHSFAIIANVDFGIECPSRIENVKCSMFAIVVVCIKC